MRLMLRLRVVSAARVPCFVFMERRTSDVDGHDTSSDSVRRVAHVFHPALMSNGGGRNTLQLSAPVLPSRTPCLRYQIRRRRFLWPRRRPRQVCRVLRPSCSVIRKSGKVRLQERSILILMLTLRCRHPARHAHMAATLSSDHEGLCSAVKLRRSRRRTPRRREGLFGDILRAVSHLDE